MVALSLVVLQAGPKEQGELMAIVIKMYQDKSGDSGVFIGDLERQVSE